MNSISKLFVSICLLTTLSLATQAQDKKQPAQKTKTEKKMKLKEHVCTQTCHDSGKHTYAHGEKGHVCTSTCKK